MQALILITLAIVAGCHGYSYVIPANIRTPGVCFYNGRILPKGDSQIPMVCQNTNCREDGSIMVDGCGRISLPNCTLVEEGVRLTKSYPECCEMTYECTDANGNNSTKQWSQLDSTDSIDFNGGVVQADVKRPKADYKLISPFILQLLLFV